MKDLTGYQIAEERIQAARKQGHTFLNLCGLGLEELPPELFELTDLKRLNLKGNKLTSIPKEIIKLTNLNKLDLDDKKLTPKITMELLWEINLSTFVWHWYDEFGESQCISEEDYSEYLYNNLYISPDKQSVRIYYPSRTSESLVLKICDCGKLMLVQDELFDFILECCKCSERDETISSYDLRPNLGQGD